MQSLDMHLGGSSYTPRSLAVAAQATYNLYFETIENKEEGQKGRCAMYGMPGHVAVLNLTAIDAAATPFRGIWSGNGRVFVAGGTKYFELNSSYALVGSVRTINDDADHTPVQFIPNGNNQLLIVSAGVVYCDSGAGPVTISMSAASGTVNTSGFAVFWVSGDTFTPSMVGQNITINAVVYVVGSYFTPTQIFLTSTAGSQSGVAFSVTEPFGGVTGAYLGGYYLVNRNNVNVRQFNWSNLNDGNIWDPLNFAQKESNPDPLRSLLVHDSQLYLWGYETFEVWQNIVDENGQPFQRINGAGGKFGSISPWGPIAIEGRVYFMSADASGGLVAYALNGFTPNRVSTYAEEAQWDVLNLGDKCISYSYREEGHTFWVINFGSYAWALDLTELWEHGEKRWTQLQVYNTSTGLFGPFVDSYHTFVPEWGTGGTHLTGGKLSSTLYDTSVNTYTDGGFAKKWVRDLPYDYGNGGCNIYFGRMTLEMETGTGPASPEDTISRQRSDDRGVTFGTAQTAGIGIAGDKSKRVYWPSGGAARDPVWRFSGVSSSKVALVNLIAELEVGSS